MPADIAALIQAIRTEKSFDSVGLILLRRLLEHVNDELGSSRFAGQGQVLRGLIHLRTEDTYRQVLAVSRSATTGEWMIEPIPATISSAKEWRRVAERQAAVSNDMPLGKINESGPGQPTVVLPSPPDKGEGAKTRENRLGLRSATHLFSAPLRAPGGVLDGMVCIEVNCPAALGDDFIWERCTARVQLLCDLAAPYLLQLPRQVIVKGEPDKFLPVIGPSMEGVIQILRVFAQQEETLLISGATGVGKSRLSRWCHELSPRKRGPFETVDLTSVPENLQLAELCGWKKGAFTDAQKDTPGAFSRAENGTLFIDEIDKLSLKAQSGLLRILEDRKYRPLGDRSGEQIANVRFIIGTNADLHAAVRAGLFREDLYYRINVLPVKVPALAERRDEIVSWARYMLPRRHGKAAGKVGLSLEAEALLMGQPWPGNLRQLDNIIRRAYALALIDQGHGATEIILTQQHIERALQWETWPLKPRTLSDLMMEAAEAFVAASQQRPLDLDMADSFRGFVLAAAIQRLGNRDAAFRLLGKEQLVRNRNHQKTLKRETDRAALLCEAIGEQPNIVLGRIDNLDESDGI